jgi:hypothetical protein
LLLEVVAHELPRRLLPRIIAGMALFGVVFGLFHRHVDIVGGGNAASQAVSPQRQRRGVDNGRGFRVSLTMPIGAGSVGGNDANRALFP